MKRFVLLGQTRTVELQELLNKRLLSWMSMWTVTRKAEVEVLQVKSDGKLISTSGLPIDKYPNSSQSEEFAWPEFIFERHLALCPKDKTFESTVSQVKAQFINEALGLPLNSDKQKWIKSVCSDRVIIVVRVAGVGEMSFYHHFDQLMVLLDAPKTSQRRNSLVKLMDAVDTIEFDAVVKIGLGEINFKDMLSLKEGKILGFDSKVENNFHLSINNKKMSGISLGKMNNKRAVCVRGVV